MSLVVYLVSLNLGFEADPASEWASWTSSSFTSCMITPVKHQSSVHGFQVFWHSYLLLRNCRMATTWVTHSKKQS